LFKRVLKKVLIYLFIDLLLIYAILVFRFFDELKSAEQAISKGNMKEGILFLKKSGEIYLPLNPCWERPINRLWQIGSKAELKNDTNLAFLAYRTIREVIIESRTFFIPKKEILDIVNVKISKLMAQEYGAGSMKEKSREEVELIHAKILYEIKDPFFFWSLVSISGFILWIGSVFFFLYSGLDETLKIVRKKFVVTLSCFFLGIILWILGMLLS